MSKLRAALAAWHADLDEEERVLLTGLFLLAGGFLLVWIPLAMIVPGAVLAAVALGFRFGPMVKLDGEPDSDQEAEA